MFSQFFFCLPPELMTALATVLGFAFLGDLTAEQQNSLGNFLMLIGQILETNASQAQVLKSAGNNQQLSDMQKAIAQLQEEVQQLKGQKE